MRKAEIKRKTKETDIFLSLDLDGKGMGEIETGIAFFDHMLTAFKTHSGFDLTVSCKGDIEVDCHHTIEDVGIVLGQAFLQALGSKVGIERFFDCKVCMDESIASCAVDISGRGFLVFKAGFFRQFCGEMETAMAEEFFRAFSQNAQIALHIECPYGTNDHHKLEAIFKAFARCLKYAVKITSDKIVSSKGKL